MHWIFWQAARKRRLRSLERARQQALEWLDKAEAYHLAARGILSEANRHGDNKPALANMAYAHKALRLAEIQALEALDELEAARCER